MYKPNFCSECGSKVLRLRWHFWTSRKFCGKCARRLRRARLARPLFAMFGLFGAGYLAGQVRRADPPPLIIERKADSPLSATSAANTSLRHAPTESSANANAVNSLPPAEEVVYLCGARTKKGTPCSRRVHGPVRCWQHKGMPPMLPQDKLLVKDLVP